MLGWLVRSRLSELTTDLLLRRFVPCSVRLGGRELLRSLSLNVGFINVAHA